MSSASRWTVKKVSFFGKPRASRCHELPPFSLGFVSLIGLAVTAPVASYVAPYGAHLAHRLPRRTLEIAFGCFLLAVSLRFLVSLI